MCDIIRNNDEATKFYTGLPTYELFQHLLSFLASAYQKTFSTHLNTHGIDPKISLEDGLLLVLMRLRVNAHLEDLSYRFRIPLANVTKIIQHWIDVMHIRMRFLIKWPSREVVRANMPQIFKDLYPRARCIIDCSEIFIERPHGYQARAQTYSNYKRHNTVKFLIGISPTGAITFLSQCWGGRATDKHITQNSGFIQLLDHGDVVLADRGFDITDDLGIFGVKLEIPSYTRGKKQLSLQDVEHSKRISKVRIHVERVIGLLKNKYTILQGILPVCLIKHKYDTEHANIDKILVVCSALVNLCPSVVPD